MTEQPQVISLSVRRYVQPLLALVLGAAIAVSVSGCAPKPIYSWGEYEKSLVASYVTQDEAAARSSLELTIDAASRQGGRVPPGVYAEYGFLLYKSGQREGAIQAFQQEAALFPEAKPLMDRLIAKLEEEPEATGESAADGRQTP